MAAVWAEVAPSLDQVTRTINLRAHTVADPVGAISGEQGANATIAELAFAVVARGDDGEVNRKLIDSVQRYVEVVHSGPTLRMEIIGPDEIAEIQGLVSNLRTMTNHMAQPVFWPRVDGCGAIDEARADILDARTVYEVKSVSRKFRSSDLRQVLTYASMLYSAGNDITHVGLLNPRLGIAVNSPVSEIALSSGGLGRIEFYRELSLRMVALEVSR